jgi:hypothetical protein
LHFQKGGSIFLAKMAISTFVVFEQEASVGEPVSAQGKTLKANPN